MKKAKLIKYSPPLSQNLWKRSYYKIYYDEFGRPIKDKSRSLDGIISNNYYTYDTTTNSIVQNYYSFRNNKSVKTEGKEYFLDSNNRVIEKRDFVSVNSLNGDSIKTLRIYKDFIYNKQGNVIQYVYCHSDTIDCNELVRFEYDSNQRVIRRETLFIREITSLPRHLPPDGKHIIAKDEHFIQDLQVFQYDSKFIVEEYSYFDYVKQDQKIIPYTFEESVTYFKVDKYGNWIKKGYKGKRRIKWRQKRKIRYY